MQQRPLHLDRERHLEDTVYHQDHQLEGIHGHHQEDRDQDHDREHAHGHQAVEDQHRLLVIHLQEDRDLLTIRLLADTEAVVLTAETNTDLNTPAEAMTREDSILTIEL